MAMPEPGRFFDNRAVTKDRTDRCALSGQPATISAKPCAQFDENVWSLCRPRGKLRRWLSLHVEMKSR